MGIVRFADFPSGAKAVAPPEELVMFRATMALEVIVDAVIRFESMTGVTDRDVVTQADRQEYRAAVIRLLNERVPQHRLRAENAAADVLVDAPARRSVTGVQGDVATALETYRRSLEQAQVSGVGILR